MKKWTVVLTYPDLSSRVVHVQASIVKSAISAALEQVNMIQYPCRVAAVFIGWHIDKKEVKDGITIK